VEHVATARLGNRVGGGSWIIRSTAARSELLRIAEVALDQQIRWFQQHKMRRGGKRRQQNNCADGEGCRISHFASPPSLPSGARR
jgi:hypothetical protein